MLSRTSCEADVKSGSNKATKRRTPLYHLRMLLDLKKVTENQDEDEKIPHIPTLKEWVKQEKRKEKEEQKRVKKAMKKEKQLQKELKRKLKGAYISFLAIYISPQVIDTY